MAITRSRGKNQQLETNKNKSVELSKGNSGPESVDKFIVKSKRSLGRRIIEVVISTILWFNMFVVFYFFISSCFNYNDSFIGILKSYFKVTNNDVQFFIKLSIMYFGIGFIILFTWKMYNKKRFGNLQRRMEPKPTSEEEMLSMGLIEPEVYKILQTERIITFEKNPVRELTRRK